MKKLLTLLIIVMCHTAYSQQDAWVYFENKPNAQFYFDNPTAMLSQRSLDRRILQNIPLDMADVPIHQPYVNQVEASANITVMATSKWLNAVHVRGTTAAINALDNLTFVSNIDFADDSLDAAGKNAERPAAANTSQNVQVEFPYGGSANQIQMLNGHLLHQQDYTGGGKIIAVMDAGFPQVDVVQPFQR
ncbi:MAG TPA: peptidase S8, partial [Flavobacterium sp.]|nr:peptidase S8 [Flavobacterium sp.]